MSIKFTLKHVVDDSQVQGLYQLFLNNNETQRKTKKQFIEYIKTQVTLFGTDEFLLSQADQSELTSEDLEQLMKWGLI